jgi:transposase
LVARSRAQEEQRTGHLVAVLSCYKAGCDGFRLDRRLRAEEGLANVGIGPTGLRVDRRARRAKTDAVDVDTLLRALAGLARGDAGAWRTVRVPKSEQDARRLLRGLLAPRGIYDFHRSGCPRR